jgi:D-alanine-D-alanine ligase
MIDSDLKTSISTFALDIFRALGARDYGRIDIRLDGSGIPNFLEANLIPSLITEYGSFPKAYKINQGVDYKEMINNIALLGLSRAKTA